MNRSDYFSHCLFSNATFFAPYLILQENFWVYTNFSLSVYSLLITSTATKKQKKGNLLQLQIGYRKMRTCEGLMETRQGLLGPMNISEE